MLQNKKSLILFDILPTQHGEMLQGQVLVFTFFTGRDEQCCSALLLNRAFQNS